MATIENYCLHIRTGEEDEIYIPYFDYTMRDTDDSLISLVVTTLCLIKAGLIPLASVFIPESARGRVPEPCPKDSKAIRRVQNILKVLLTEELGFDIRYD